MVLAHTSDYLLIARGNEPATDLSSVRALPLASLSTRQRMSAQQKRLTCYTRVRERVVPLLIIVDVWR